MGPHPWPGLLLSLRESPLSRQPPQVVTRSLVGGQVCHHPDCLSPVTSSFRVIHPWGKTLQEQDNGSPARGPLQKWYTEYDGEDSLESDA